MRHRFAGYLALALGTVLLGGCSELIGPSPGTDVTVFAAASLRDAVGAAADEYWLRGSVRVRLSTDSSATLRTQIEQGAHADVFLSADTRNPDALAAAGLVDGPVVPFAGNRLAIVVPRDNPGNLATPFDLGGPGLKIVAAGEAVPITAYVRTLLGNLAGLPGAPPNLEAAYEANVVSREDNVRAALAKIELGEGDAAIVYASDAAGSDAVDTVPIAVGANVTATYAGAVLVSARDRAAAHAFLDWLAGPDGAAILAPFGFVAAP